MKLKTNFYPKDFPEKYLINGVYFKSEKDVVSEYLISAKVKESGVNCVVKIYLSEPLDNHFNTDGILVGDEIAVPDIGVELVCKLSLWGKYFFPSFEKNMQMYYDGKKYSNMQWSGDSIASMMEAINYAIEYGLDKSGIKPY